MGEGLLRRLPGMRGTHCIGLLQANNASEASLPALHVGRPLLGCQPAGHNSPAPTSLRRCCQTSLVPCCRWPIGTGWAHDKHVAQPGRNP